MTTQLLMQLDNMFQKQIKQIRTGLKLSGDVPVLPFSALDGSGRDAVWAYIEERLPARE